MKQIPMTPQIKGWLQAALGPDVEVDNYPVFESISLNDRPLPGKRGTIFEHAVVPPTTMLAMVNYINGDGGSLPLMIDHNMDGAPKGRIFHAGLNYDETTVEFRTLFYIDPTETDLIAKVNNGTYDEVSVQFLSAKILCSECGWDYRGEDASWENLLSLTCANDHHIGDDGVHTRLVGLESFVEISLVARGAADKPKIVGQSASKLSPATVERLAAQGFEDLDALIVRASLGEDHVDTNKLITDLSDAKASVMTLTASVDTLTAARNVAVAEVATLTSTVAERDASIVTLTAERDTALEASRADEADAAITYLKSVLKGVRVAAGKAVEDADLPGSVAELTTAIDAETSQLTAILPVEGVGQAAGAADEVKETRSFAAFKINA